MSYFCTSFHRYKKIGLDQFDIKSKSNTNMLLVGKRGCGKTTFIKNFIKENNYQKDEIFCASYHIIMEPELYSESINITNIRTQLPDNIIALIDKLSVNKDKFLVILDDCIFRDKKYANIVINFITYLKTQRLNLNITVMVTVQSIVGFAPQTVHLWDYRVLFTDNSTINIKKCFENYKLTVNNNHLWMIDSFKTFAETFNGMTQNHSAMILGRDGLIYHYDSSLLVNRTSSLVEDNSISDSQPREEINDNTVDDTDNINIDSFSNRLFNDQHQVQPERLNVDKHIVLVDKQIQLVDKLIQLETLRNKNS